MSTAAPEVQKRRRTVRWPAGCRGVPRLDLAVLVLALVVGLAAPLLRHWLGLAPPAARDRAAVNIFGNPTGPDGRHPFGVDSAGQDVLSRTLFGLRSLMLLALAGSAVGVLSAWLVQRCAVISPWLGWLWGLIRSALWLFPALLLGLALSGRLSPGIWRLLVPIAVACLYVAPSWRELPAALLSVLATALAIDVGLTFLGVGPGGSSPQLGAMIARAGVGIVAGVPEWWALLFPGLVVTVVLVAAQRLAHALEPPSRGMHEPTPRRAPRGGLLADQSLAAAVTLIAAAAFAVLVLPAVGGRDPGGSSALGPIGPALAASVSLIIGGVVVWALLTYLQVRALTRTRRVGVAHPSRPGRLRALVAAPTMVVAAAPVGWLGFLALYVFSESVGKLPVLPGSGAYVGLTHDPGRWAEALVMPWLVLGTAPAAFLAPSIARAAQTVTGSGQQRVARGAGVPEATLARQRRRALSAPLLALAARALSSFLGVALILELTFRIPGAGLVTLSAVSHGRLATVSDVALGAALTVLVARLILSALIALIDPRAARA